MQPEKPDVVFVINPSIWYRAMYPSGIIFLAAYLRSLGVKCEVLDSALSSRRLPEDERDELILQAVRLRKPKIVCFSASHIELAEVVRINNKLRGIDGTIKTIVGGSQPTYRPDDFLSNGFDFVCVGEGEKTLYDFVVQAQQSRPEWSAVNGLMWKDGNTIVRNAPRELMSEAEIRSLPLPAYDLIDRRYFAVTGGLVRGLPLRGAMLLTTRGCPFNCSFCGCNLIFGRRLRSKTLQQIEAEVIFLKKNFDIEGVWIIDDTFTINREHVRGVSDILKRHNIIWGCQSRANTIDEDMIKTIKLGGCKQVDIGVESGSQRVLDEIIQKKITVEQVITAFDLARKYQIRTLANFMIGFPTETLAELEQTRQLAERIRADVYVFGIATPLPGTKLYDMVGVPISTDEYCQLDWRGSPLTERFNKSEIPDLLAALAAIQKPFHFRSLFKSLTSMDNLLFFLTRGSKLKRLSYVLNHFMRKD
jgi:anaerobic magnesium-protoporphyrin IX monomethyl ester cyclase